MNFKINHQSLNFNYIHQLYHEQTMPKPSSVVDVKQFFLHTQIRTLNATLELSPQWLESAPSSEHSDLDEKTVQDVFQKRM